MTHLPEPEHWNPALDREGNKEVAHLLAGAEADERKAAEVEYGRPMLAEYLRARARHRRTLALDAGPGRRPNGGARMSALPRLDLRLYLTAADILCALHRGGSFRREGSRWVLTPPGEVSVQVPGAAARLLLKKCWIRSLPPSRGEVVYYAKV